MARDGAQLLLADLNGDGAKILADELRQASSGAPYPYNRHSAYARSGLSARLDVLFNNAGIAEVRQLLELTEDEWDRTLAVNLRAVFFVFQGVARRMRHQNLIAGSGLRGKLIQTTSIAAYRGGQAYMVHYAASKAGVVSITRTAGSLRIASVLARLTRQCGGRSRI
jgi:meso-butanediol dehydrogenase / (S,S)-butanediol dehydrogenase / diacetyl reductase